MNEDFWFWLGYVLVKAYPHLSARMRETVHKTFTEWNPEYTDVEEQHFLRGAAEAKRER